MYKQWCSKVTNVQVYGVGMYGCVYASEGDLCVCMRVNVYMSVGMLCPVL